MNIKASYYEPLIEHFDPYKLNVMEQFTIRSFQTADETAIENITYRTGFKGEDLDEHDYFNDRRLFYLIFIAYYARYEPEHFFVAMDKSNNDVIGFICGTTDTKRQEKQFRRKMVWRIFLRALFFTSWRYPKTMKTALNLTSILFENPSISNTETELLELYPAHLHINVLPEYQHVGIGTRLINHFEDHLLKNNIGGVHLGTSSRNYKALPFYQKHGYQIIREIPIKSHPRFDNLSTITFAKNLAETNR